MIIEEGNLLTYESAAEILYLDPRNHTMVMHSVVSIATDCVELRSADIAKVASSEAHKRALELKECIIDFGDGEYHPAIKAFKASFAPGTTIRAAAEYRWDPPPVGQPEFGSSIRYHSLTDADLHKYFDPFYDCPRNDWKHVVCNTVLGKVWDVVTDRLGHEKRTPWSAGHIQTGPFPLSTDVILSAGGVLVIGPAGSGKTYAVKQFVKECRKRGLKIAIVSHTNKAAFNAGGQTVCTALGFPGESGHANIKKIYAIAEKLNVLVWDEVYQSPFAHITLAYVL